MMLINLKPLKNPNCVYTKTFLYFVVAEKYNYINKYKAKIEF